MEFRCESAKSMQSVDRVSSGRITSSEIGFTTRFAGDTKNKEKRIVLLFSSARRRQKPQTDSAGRGGGDKKAGIHSRGFSPS